MVCDRCVVLMPRLDRSAWLRGQRSCWIALGIVGSCSPFPSVRLAFSSPGYRLTHPFDLIDTKSDLRQLRVPVDMVERVGLS